jgi:integrase
MAGCAHRLRRLADHGREGVPLLRAILMTAAVEDRLIPRNPCQIKGADREHAEERPVLTVAQVPALAELMPYRKYRTLILVTAFCSLRWGEVTALRRCDVAPDGSWVRVNSQFIDLIGRGLVRTPPKSRAGARTITVPAAIRADVVAHLRDSVGPDPEALVFTMLRGGAMRRGNFNSQRTTCTTTMRTTTERPARWSRSANGTGMARKARNQLTRKAQVYRGHPLAWAFPMERVTGIEPASRAWEALILPLNYTRDVAEFTRARPAAAPEGPCRCCRCSSGRR